MIRFALVFSLLFPSAALAAPTIYRCETASSVRSANWLPDESLYIIDTSAGTASAYDGVVHHFFNEPIQAELTERRDGSFRVRWRVRDIPVNNTQTADGTPVRQWESKVTARFTVNLDPDTMEYTIRGIAGRLGNDVGRGTCQAIN